MLKNEQPSRADRAIARLVAAAFTKTSLALHAVVYPVLILWEGGDWHYFLNGISIEAVFMTLCVGISTKQLRERQYHTHKLLHRLIRRGGEPVGHTTDGEW